MAAVLASVNQLERHIERGKKGEQRDRRTSGESSGSRHGRRPPANENDKHSCKPSENDLHVVSEIPGQIPRQKIAGDDGFNPTPIVPTPQLGHSDGSDDSDDDYLEADTCRQQVFLFLEDPDSSTGARIFSLFVLYTIVISIASFVLETLPDLKDFRLWKVIEPVTTIIFTLEYVGRLIVCDAFPPDSAYHQKKCEFIRSPMNILDLLAILPFYLEVAAQELMKSVRALRVLRAVRLIRCFRIFKLSKYSLGMTIMVESLHNSIQPLSILTFFLMIGVVLTSSLMFFAERTGCPDVQHMINVGTFQKYQNQCKELDTGRDSQGNLCCNKHGSALDYESIYQTFWWSMVTMTTVGYGDKVPRTLAGRLVGAFAMVSGIILISLPVAVVASNFQQTYDLLKLEEDADDLLDEQENRANHVTYYSSEDAYEDRPKSVERKRRSVEVEKLDHSLPRPLQGDDGEGKQDDLKRIITTHTTHTQATSHTTSHEKSSGESHRISHLRALLKAFEEKNCKLSEKARREVFLAMELLDHIERVEKQVKGLREKDTHLSAAMRKEFVALSRCHENMSRDRGAVHSFD